MGESERSLKALPKDDRDCHSCAHEHDSGTEHCGCCDGHAWVEASWHVMDRANAEIERLTREKADIMAEMKTAQDIAAGRLARIKELERSC